MRRSVASFTVTAIAALWPALASGRTTTIHPNTAAPSSEAERNAFQTPTAGKDHRQTSPGTTSGAASGAGKSDTNPEGRLSDHGPKNVQPNDASPEGVKK